MSEKESSSIQSLKDRINELEGVIKRAIWGISLSDHMRDVARNYEDLLKVLGENPDHWYRESGEMGPPKHLEFDYDNNTWRPDPDHTCCGCVGDCK